MTHRVAAFDFDGTLLKGDAVLPFCSLAGGKLRAITAIILDAPLLIAVGMGKGDRNELKRRFVRRCLSKVSANKMHAAAETFTDTVVGRRLNPKVAERLEWHRSQGHECVIVSASLDVYLVPIADRLGVTSVLSTRLERLDNTYTGELDGPNVRADEKARRLRAHLAGRDDVEIWAYGNSRDDDAMLAMANHALRVDKSGEMIAER